MSRKIKLTKGQFATVDDADHEWLSQWKWYATWSKHGHRFYVTRSIQGLNGKQRTLHMHRLILGLGFGDKLQGDHINRNALDNCRKNLRIVTCQQNLFNKKGVKGYFLCSQSKKYRATIKVSGKNIYLGSHVTKQAARAAYVKAKKQYHTF